MRSISTDPRLTFAVAYRFWALAVASCCYVNGSGTASLITGSDRETVHRYYISGTELQRGGAADAMDRI